MAGMQGFEDGPADGAAAVTTPTYSCSTPPAELDTPAATAPDSPASSAWNGAQHTQQQQPQQQPLPLPLPEHEGLLARCVHRLYASIGERRDSVQCSVSISCTEVYNETVTDMLARNKNQQLPVRTLAAPRRVALLSCYLISPPLPRHQPMWLCPAVALHLHTGSPTGLALRLLYGSLNRMLNETSSSRHEPKPHHKTEGTSSQTRLLLALCMLHYAGALGPQV
jgi:hypothetical protein